MSIRSKRLYVQLAMQARGLRENDGTLECLKESPNADELRPAHVRICMGCLRAGLLVLLDMHVLEAGTWPDGGVIHVGMAKQQLVDAWDRLASALCDADAFWNIMGADLKNEPYGMWWGPEGHNDAEAANRDTLSGTGPS